MTADILESSASQKPLSRTHSCVQFFWRPLYKYKTRETSYYFMTITRLLEFVLAGHGGHLQVALHLLANLLEAVHHWHAGDRVDARQRVQTHP